MAGMIREHIEEKDSNIEFTTTNYGITTTSRIEWAFVASQNEELSAKALKDLNLDSWPVETKGLSDHHSGRVQRPLNLFVLERAGVDERLKEQDTAPLLEAEFLGGRLCARRHRICPCPATCPLSPPSTNN